MRDPGHILFAVGLAGIGALSLISGDFAFTWQPVPAGVPFRQTLAYLSGALLLAAGIGTLVKRVAVSSAMVTAAYLLALLLLLQAPRVVRAPGNVGVWLGFAESTVLLVGGWLLFVSLAGKYQGTVRVARFLFGLACLELGLSHFVYAETTANMVPAWLPARLGFAYLTGAGHFAAGLGILFSVLPRLAATLEAIMISLFVLLLHIPGVAAEPRSRLQWTMMFVASALAGAAWNTARSLRDAPWGLARISSGVLPASLPAGIPD